MKRVTNTCDKSAVYRTNGLGKITAPNSAKKDEPRAVKTVGGDLRGGKK